MLRIASQGKSGSGIAKIEIRSSFGKIIVGEPKADDLREIRDNSKRQKMATLDKHDWF